MEYKRFWLLGSSVRLSKRCQPSLCPISSHLLARTWKPCCRTSVQKENHNSRMTHSKVARNMLMFLVLIHILCTTWAVSMPWYFSPLKSEIKGNYHSANQPLVPFGQDRFGSYEDNARYHSLAQANAAKCCIGNCYAWCPCCYA